MKEKIQQTIAEIAARHADKRLRVFEVQVQSLEGGGVKLGGRVLEKANVQEIERALPDVKIDSSEVRVLRKEPPQLRIVATNLTDLHKESAFVSEMLTQVLNGTVLEILEEKEDWCFVRQSDGYLGWAYRPFFAPLPRLEPSHVVTAPTLTIYSERDGGGAGMSCLLGGTMIHVTEVRGDWARVKPAGNMLPEGWVPVDGLRPLSVMPLPADEARRQLVTDARRFFGVYYLWGGNSAWGTDCSGLAQLVHRLSGYTLPRDCDMQYAAGRPVEPPFAPGDLLYFSRNRGDGRKVTHVGISTGGWKTIHCSRRRNGVYEEDVQENQNLRETFAGARSFLRD